MQTTRKSSVKIVRFYENHAQDSRVKPLGQVCETVSRKWGTGGGNVPLVVESRRTEPSPSGRGSEMKQEKVKFVVNFQGSKGNNVVSRENVSFSPNAMHGHDVHVVMTEKKT